MALYLISYDVRSKNRDYSSLIDRLREYKAIRVLESVWLLPYSSIKASELIGTDLKQHLQTGDSLLTQEVGMDASWSNLKISDGETAELLRRARF